MGIESILVVIGKASLTTVAAGIATYVVLRLVYNDRGVFAPPVRKDLAIAAGAIPLLGHTYTSRQNMNWRLDRSLENSKQYGPVFQLTVPNIRIVVTTDVDDLAHIMGDPYNYRKGIKPSDYKLLEDLLGHGIFNSDGAEWRSQRKIAANIFNVKNFVGLFADAFSEEARLICMHLDKAASKGLIVEMQDLLLRSTLNSFVKISMGVSIGALEVEARDVNGVYTLPDVDFMQSFDGCAAIIARRGPWWRYVEPYTESGKKMKKYAQVMNDFASRIVQEKRAKIEAGKTLPNKDLLDLFMQNGNEDGSELSTSQLRDIVMNFIIAGRDTTSQTLSWCLWNVSTRPDVEKQMYDEIISVVGQTQDISYEHCKSMKYVTAVFNETLRLYPNVPAATKRVVKDDILPGTHTKVYAGEVVSWSSYVRGRLESIWGPDASDFKPSRWIMEDGSLMKPSAAKWPAFNLGPRICLGMGLATQEGICFLATILRRYHLELVNDDEPRHWGDPKGKRGRYGLSLTLSMRGGVEFKIHPRKNGFQY
ncbi:hypothetical protein SmJEL517_g04672 [Synchytrium microbalum]|uniref:Cytochrome P450 n=1 Tax=Synchytrium microbalum TaxID=1806994 RepID=A0A507C3M9_9FUNG|nr:uncharacterized protein SmJEL517_g04672 [Synchytrium microbalum]TPX32165.1 hypothetical protein SmJEL517_g04672 [Synchytrium microbalum]